MGFRSARVVAYRGQQRLEVLTARVARVQVRRDARVTLFRRLAGGDQVDVDMQHLHRLGAADIARISALAAAAISCPTGSGSITSASSRRSRHSGVRPSAEISVTTVLRLSRIAA